MGVQIVIMISLRAAGGLLLLLPYLATAATVPGQQFSVTTTLRGAPYLDLKTDHAGRTGNDKYEGYIMDLLAELGSKLGCTFSIHMVADGRYGQYDSASGAWTGMIGEVISGAADMAVVDMTITSQREEVVDFSVPFMHVGITALYKKKSGQATPIHAEDLLHDSSIQLGTYCCGSTNNFFKNSPLFIYQEIHKKINEHKGPELTNNNEGVQRVLESDGDYAFFMESPSAEYAVGSNCQLTTVGGLLDSKGYGIALPQGSPHREGVNIALLQLRENGTLDKINMKWFYDRANQKKVCKIEGGWLQTFWNVVSTNL